MSVLQEAHTKKVPGLITLLSVPLMPAAFWMTHGPHSHRVGSCSPAAAVQQSAAATHAIAVRTCVPHTRQYTVWGTIRAGIAGGRSGGGRSLAEKRSAAGYSVVL